MAMRQEHKQEQLKVNVAVNESVEAHGDRRTGYDSNAVALGWTSKPSPKDEKMPLQGDVSSDMLPALLSDMASRVVGQGEGVGEGPISAVGDNQVQFTILVKRKTDQMIVLSTPERKRAKTE